MPQESPTVFELQTGLSEFYKFPRLSRPDLEEAACNGKITRMRDGTQSPCIAGYRDSRVSQIKFS